jgi:hypothetical protein
MDKFQYGEQTIFDGQSVSRYSTNGNFYFLNENQFHGSMKVPYVRGLVFIDGIFNVKQLELTESSLIQLFSGPRALENL